MDLESIEADYYRNVYGPEFDFSRRVSGEAIIPTKDDVRDVLDTHGLHDPIFED